MNSPEEHDGGVAWDDVVDVVCVGDGPGVLAFGFACAAAGLDVLRLAVPGRFDDETTAYLAAMTDDLRDEPGQVEAVPLRAVPEPLRRDVRGRPDTLEPFVGQQLRDWSARCLASSSGVLFTEVPGIFGRMRTESGEIITAVEIDGSPELAPDRESFAGLVYVDGRIAGVQVQRPSGPLRVRADLGVAFSVGPAGPVPPEAGVLVSRPAGRFARLEIVDRGGV